MNRLKTVVLVAVIAMLAIPALGATSGTSTSSYVDPATGVSVAGSDSWAKTVNTNVNLNTNSSAFIGGASSSSVAIAQQWFVGAEFTGGATNGNAYGLSGNTVSVSDAKGDANVKAGAGSLANGAIVNTGGNSWSVLGIPNRAHADAWDTFIWGNGNSAANATSLS